MKTLHIVHTESSCGWGGQEIRILTEAAGMQARGHRLTLVVAEGSRIAEAAAEYGLKAVVLPIAKKNLRGLGAMRAWLAANAAEIDIINTHSSTDSWLVALAQLLMRHPRPVVRTRHVSSPVNRKFTTRWLYQSACRHVVVTGEALRQQLHVDNGFALDSMTSVPTGIDLQRFAPAAEGHSHAAPVLGIVATLRNWKGHVYLFQAFAALAERFADWQLLIVGDGPQRHNLERLAGELGIAGRVRFVGNQPNVPDWLRQMDVFVLPSYGDEGVPQSILQAMACGLPVVSTTVGAIGEAIVDQETGFLIPPRDTAALAQALATLMDDSGLRQRFGQQGHARAQQRFGLDRMLDQMEAIFQAHAGGSR